MYATFPLSLAACNHGKHKSTNEEETYQLLFGTDELIPIHPLPQPLFHLSEREQHQNTGGMSS